MRSLRVVLAITLAILWSMPAAAQEVSAEGSAPPASAIEGRPLPEGHPPVEGAAPAGELPQGHPPVEGAAPAGELPQGHPPVEGAAPTGELPQGHPPVEGAAPTGELPQGHPPVEGAAPAPHGSGAVANILAPPTVGRAVEDPELPAGTIRVTVVDVNGRPVADSPVDVGLRTQTEDRARHNARTDEQGQALFENLATGVGQAYRVNVPYLGATYSSDPFQLPPDRGYDVRITRLPVTRDSRFVFFQVFRVVVELKDERLHIIHQAELTNAGHETYVFPAEGVRVALPDGAIAFQAQRVMTDQRVEELPGGGGYVLRGSLPRGTTRLAWAYDVPVKSANMRLPIELPLPFFTLQVFSEAPEGLVLDVTGMPSPQRMTTQGGQAVWGTQLRRGPTDPPLERLTVSISGIPGPGPLRWIAVAVALLFLVGGVVLRLNRVSDREAAEEALARRRAALLAEIRALEAEFEAGEVGPRYRQTRRDEIVRELASLLHEEAAMKTKDSAASAKPSARPAPTR